MALSYGLTNPAAFKKGGGSEPAIIGYKLYKLQYEKVWESNDFGLNWNECTFASGDATNSYKQNLVYDPVNNKVVILGNYTPYNQSETNYSFYATPQLNATTSFTLGTRRPKSTYVYSSTNDKDTQYGTVFDYETNSLVSLHNTKTNYSSTIYDNFTYLINDSYLTPNTFASPSFIISRPDDPKFSNVVTSKEGITLEIASESDNGFKANLFRFVKNSSTSYSKQIVAAISVATLGIYTNYKMQACYLKNIGFVLKWAYTNKLYTRVIYLDGTLSSERDWGSCPNAEIYTALSSNNFYDDKVYLAHQKAVYYTSDGINWNTCSGVLGMNADGEIYNAIILNSGNNIVVGTGSYFQVSNDGGNTFTRSNNSIIGSTRPENMYIAGSNYAMILVPIYA